MNVEEIRALIELFETSSLTELSLRREGVHLVLKRAPGGNAVEVAPLPEPSPPGAVVPPPAAPPEAEQPAPAGHAITSPLVGTFYRRPSPQEPPYVEVGQRVEVGDTLCIVEAMKVMNEIKADRAGVVREIAVEDGHVVEFGQVLIVLDPA